MSYRKMITPERLQAAHNVIKQNIREAMMTYCNFRYNSQSLRNTLYTLVNNIMIEQFEQHMVDTYEIICDDRNNPCEVIENNDIVVDVYYVDLYKQKQHIRESFNNIHYDF